MKNLAWIFDKYGHEFDHILESNIHKLDDINTYVDIEDLRQTLYLTWIDLFHKYYTGEKPNSFIKTYLKRMSSWYIRDFFQRVSTQEIPVGKIDISILPKMYEFKLDLKFVVYGTEFYPLGTLKKSERYLIYLKYGLDKSNETIGKLLNRNRKTVSKNLEEILDKLRRKIRDGTT